MPAVYAVFTHNVTDPEQLRKYSAAAGPTLARAEVVAADQKARTLEGDPVTRVVILKFADEEAARSWYDSDEYQALLPLRLNAVTDEWAGLVTGLSD